MPSADSETVASDIARDGLVERLRAEFGGAVAGVHLVPGVDLWVRVTSDVWGEAARVARDGLHMEYFGFVSVIDWLPSPFGRSMDSSVDVELAGSPNEGEEAAPSVIESGFAGGDTRFQVFARVHDLDGRIGITLKADVPEETLTVASWTSVYGGANWHEREAWEMYGINFAGHPQLRNLYLPTGFEGNPLRKDFPLLARHVKPWPGIVDVEGMPGEAEGDAADGGDE